MRVGSSEGLGVAIDGSDSGRMLRMVGSGDKGRQGTDAAAAKRRSTTVEANFRSRGR